ncbi:unnamed protein product [Rotaria socialis]|uniref:F-box domain-containing protein n=1 Tax=Rotaria socialis TaxID=392032 RepID=A0A817YIE6_9BILA|nr:unnamed protein product [Rotaria socialis]
MNNSIVRIVDLPDEILVTILKKLHHFDVLYSLVGVNKKLDNVACDVTFTRSIDLTTISLDKADDSRINAILDRFCIEILPRIQKRMECLTIQACFLQRVYHASDYLNLRSITIVNLELKMAPDIFFKKSSFIHGFKDQIKHLSVKISDEIRNELRLKLLTDIYNCIFALVSSLKYLDLGVNDNYFFRRSLLSGLSSTTFSSSSIVHLNIKMNNFDDCRYLLDGRLTQLHTFIANLDYIYDPVLMRVNPSKIRKISSNIKINTSTLLKLKCFSLYVYLPTTEFDNEVVPFLCRMSHLEKLTLSLGVRGRNSFIDGTHLDNCIFSRLPHLHAFVFDIITDFVRSTGHFEPSADHIRRTFIQRGHHADCYIDYHHSNMRRCHVYSVPLNMECMRHISHGFPGGTFINVRILSMLDDSHPFEHNFFAQISRSFPLLSRLILRNTTPQTEKRSHQLVKLEEISSVIEYSHLIELDCTHAHIDYVEQFLSNVNTCLPCLCKLHVQYEHLVSVTENFTRNTTLMNCVKVKHITFDDNVATARSKDFYLYFPLL